MSPQTDSTPFGNASPRLALILFIQGGLSLLCAVLVGVLHLVSPPAYRAILNDGYAWLSLAMLAFALLFAVSGASVLRNREAGRRGAVILSGISILAFPIGTVLGLYSLYLAWRMNAAPHSKPPPIPSAKRAFRTWTHRRSGSYTEARLIEVSADTVTLEKRDGKRAVLPIIELTDEDKAYLAAVE